MIQIAQAVVDITPQHPVYFRGHAMRSEQSQGVHDALQAEFMWLHIDEVYLLFMNADLGGLDYPLVHEVKQRICAKLPIEKERIILSASHTHSGPLLLTRNTNQPHDPIYRQYVIDTMVEGALHGFDDFQEVHQVVYTKGESQGYYGNRNDKEQYGDQVIYVIKFLDAQGEALGVFVNLSCHCTILSPMEYTISGDLIGGLRRELTNIYGVTPIVTNGNAGDMSNRLYRKGNDYAALSETVSGIVQQIQQFPPFQPLYISNPQVRTFTYHVAYPTDKQSLKKRVEDYQLKLAGTKDFEERKWILSEINGFQHKLSFDETILDFETTILRLHDLEIVAVPCELVSAFGRQIKKSSTAPLCIVWGYANGQTTYVVEASGFQGGHDGISTCLLKGQAEEYVAKIIQNLYS